MIQSGNMSELVRIESPVRNDRQEVVNWRQHELAWLELRELSMNELEAGGAIMTHRGFGNLVPGISPDMRVLWNPTEPLGPLGYIRPTDRILEIVSIIENRRAGQMELRLVEQAKLAGQ